MEEFLMQLMGKKVDVSCGMNAVVRGDVVAVKEGILYLRDEDVAVIWEVKDHEVRPGFVVGKKS
jgi:hypothetical protein